MLSFAVSRGCFPKLRNWWNGSGDRVFHDLNSGPVMIGYTAHPNPPRHATDYHLPMIAISVIKPRDRILEHFSELGLGATFEGVVLQCRLHVVVHAHAIVGHGVGDELRQLVAFRLF